MIVRKVWLVARYRFGYSSRVDCQLAVLPGKIIYGRTRLTDRFITAIKPSRTIIYVFDSEVGGLAIRTYPSGRKTFIFDYRQDYRQRRVTIGQFPAWTIGKARAHASRLRVRVDSGENVVPRAASGSQI